MTYLVAAVLPELLERLEVLQGHGAVVDLAGGREDAPEGLAEALGLQDGRLALALGAQDGRLLLALGDVDGRLALALGLGDDGASRPLRGEHAVHRILDAGRRDELADLDRGDLAAPALRLLVEAGAQDVVDLVALGEHVVEVHVADDRAKGRRGDAPQRARKL